MAKVKILLSDAEISKILKDIEDHYEGATVRLVSKVNGTIQVRYSYIFGESQVITFDHITTLESWRQLTPEAKDSIVSMVYKDFVNNKFPVKG